MIFARWILLFALGLIPITVAAQSKKLRIDKQPGALLVRNANGDILLRYQTEVPRQIPLSVESACFFHPLTTPLGVPLTDLAPADHLHHRGIFLGWVEMHGRKDADFWGWGEHAPKKERRIISKRVSDLWARNDAAGFRAQNEWQAENDPLVQEELTVEFRVLPSANVLDLTYKFKVDEELMLAQWAFGGFCVRARKDGQVETLGPSGPVDFPNPNHLRPDSDWPDAAWYGHSLKLTNGVAGIAVLNHPGNPRTSWFVDRDLRVINPSITAPGPVRLLRRKPLVLRYRVVAQDGALSRTLLNRLAEEWAKK